jgi:lipid-binding SYLF domain-containing protein
MKKISMIRISTLSLLLAGLIVSGSLFAQDSKAHKLIGDCQTAKAEFTKSDPLMANLFASSHAYVIFPNVGKGGIGVGGAAGNGIVFQNGRPIGTAKMKQVTVGFQFGGQAYREVIFFENASAFDRFKSDNFELAAQASAVAVTKGASVNVKYRGGVMVFTQKKGGLMYEASVGGQKFDFTPF